MKNFGAPLPENHLARQIRASIAQVQAMSPADRKAMYQRQRQSFVRGEAAFGSDADEAEYAAALRAGDQAAIAECERKACERVSVVERVMEDDGA